MTNYKNTNLDNWQVYLRKFNFTWKYKRICFQSAVCKNKKKRTNMLIATLTPLCSQAVPPPLFFISLAEMRNIPLIFWTGNRHSKKAAHEAETLWVPCTVHQCPQIWPLMKPFTCRCRPGCVDTSPNSGNCCFI